MRTEAKQNECRDADSTASTYRHAHRTGAAPKGFLKFREGLAAGARPFQPYLTTCPNLDFASKS